jgi:hypothetical protein
MTNDTREDDLRYAALTRGLALIHTATGYALAEYKLTGASLDDVERYLGTDGSSEARQRDADERRQRDHEHWTKVTIAALEKRAEEREQDKQRQMEMLKKSQIKSSLQQKPTGAEIAEIRDRLRKVARGT